MRYSMYTLDANLKLINLYVPDRLSLERGNSPGDSRLPAATSSGDVIVYIQERYYAIIVPETHEWYNLWMLLHVFELWDALHSQSTSWWCEVKIPEDIKRATQQCK